MQSPTIHPSQTKNRLAKAVRIVKFLDANPETFPARSADEVADFTPQTWRLVMMAMQEPRLEVSTETISAVLGILVGRDL